MNNKRVIIGLIASCFFIYLIIWIPQLNLLFKGEVSLFQALFAKHRLDFPSLVQVIVKIKLLPLVLSFLVTPLHVLVRSRRWVGMLEPLGRLKLFDSFSIVMVSYMSNSILPLRIGEIVRGVLVGRRIGISNSSGLGSVALDRVLDVLALIVIIILTGFMFDFPPEMQKAANILKTGSICLVIAFVLAGIFLRSVKNLLNKLFLLFPARIAEKMKDIVFSFISGFRSLKKPQGYFEIIIETFLIWILFAGQIFLMLIAFGFTVDYPKIASDPIFVSLVILMSSAIVLSVPSAPSGIGTFHAAMVLALTLMGVATEEAAGFALVIHAVSVSYYIIGGFPFMWREGLKLKILKNLSAIESK